MAELAAAEARAKEALYRLGAAVFLYPTPEQLTRLKEGAIRLDSGEGPLSPSLADLVGIIKRIRPSLSLPLEEAYCRLFRVNPPAPPYESHYIDKAGLGAGGIAATLEEEYATVGLTPKPSLNEPPDHLSMEMEFLAHLSGKEAAAWEEWNPEVALDWREERRGFLNRHLAQWLSLFQEKVLPNSPPTIYSSALRMAEELLAVEIERSPVKKSTRETCLNPVFSEPRDTRDEGSASILPHLCKGDRIKPSEQT
ncbi:molecular chaperone TorD family protein [bacterium]|nr:molecular chaperone TorD family protein [bacterium]